VCVLFPCRHFSDGRRGEWKTKPAGHQNHDWHHLARRSCNIGRDTVYCLTHTHRKKNREITRRGADEPTGLPAAARMMMIPPAAIWCPSLSDKNSENASYFHLLFS
jgi:hypothetical protein